MNQTKKQFESLLTLHYKLCRAEENELSDLGLQIRDVFQFVERYKLFPVDLSEQFREQLTLMCERGSKNLKLILSKELYLYLGRMMFDFEESNIVKMDPYIKLLELNRTEYPYELSNDWGSEIKINNEFEKELFFFSVTSKYRSISKEKYLSYCNELRREPIDINAYFDDEKVLPSSLSSEVEKVLEENYKKCNDYIEEHYSLIKKAFSTYHKDVRVYIQSRYGNAYLVMINVYEGVSSGVTIYPNIVDVMYRFFNVEAIEEKKANSILTGINNSDFSNIKHIFSISGIHHELNRLFVRYAPNEDLTYYLVYILRGQLKRVSLINDTEIEVDGVKNLLMFSKIPSMKELLEYLGKGTKEKINIVFRSRPDDSLIEALKNEGVSCIDVMHLGQSLINNQNGEMVHWFIKNRLNRIRLDDSYRELSIGDQLIKQLENCPKGQEGWKQYEIIGGEIFRFLFENTFRNYTYEYQSSTLDGTQRRDLVVNNTYKDSPSFWQLVKSDYHSNIIVVDFKNYREALNSDSFFIPTKYLNSVVGYFVIVFSRCGLDETAKKVQHNLLSEKKLVLCLNDADLKNMINQKTNGQDPLDSLENMYYTLCKDL